MLSQGQPPGAAFESTLRAQHPEAQWEETLLLVDTHLQVVEEHFKAGVAAVLLHVVDYRDEWGARGRALLLQRFHATLFSGGLRYTKIYVQALSLINYPTPSPSGRKREARCAHAVAQSRLGGGHSTEGMPRPLPQPPSALSNLNFRVDMVPRASFYLIESSDQPQFLGLTEH